MLVKPREILNLCLLYIVLFIYFVEIVSVCFLVIEPDQYYFEITGILEGQSAKVDLHPAGKVHLLQLLPISTMFWGLAFVSLLGIVLLQQNIHQVLVVRWKCSTLIPNLRLVLCAEVTDGVTVPGILQILPCPGIRFSENIYCLPIGWP